MSGKLAIRNLAILGVLAFAGCGDLGDNNLGDNRRNASGSIGGTGLVGIESEASTAAPAPQQAVPTPAAAAPGASSAPLPGTAAAKTMPPQAAGAAPAASQATSAAAPTTVRERADVGASGKGNYEPGILTTPVRAYFTAKEDIIFNIQIPYAMKLYEAEKGYKPKTQDDFMKEIIVAGNIKLPELPLGHRYLYDPEKGELFVERTQ